MSHRISAHVIRAMGEQRERASADMAEANSEILRAIFRIGDLMSDGGQSSVQIILMNNELARLVAHADDLLALCSRILRRTPVAGVLETMASFGDLSRSTRTAKNLIELLSKQAVLLMQAENGQDRFG